MLKPFETFFCIHLHNELVLSDVAKPMHAKPVQIDAGIQYLKAYRLVERI